MEKYEIEDIEEKPKELLNDDALDEIIPVIRKKYLMIVLLNEQFYTGELKHQVK